MDLKVIWVLVGSLGIWVLKESKVPREMWVREEWWVRQDQRESRGLKEQEELGVSQDPKESLALRVRMAERESLDYQDLRVSLGKMELRGMPAYKDFLDCRVPMDLRESVGIRATLVTQVLLD